MIWNADDADLTDFSLILVCVLSAKAEADGGGFDLFVVFGLLFQVSSLRFQVSSFRFEVLSFWNTDCRNFGNCDNLIGSYLKNLFDTIVTSSGVEN